MASERRRLPAHGGIGRQARLLRILRMKRKDPVIVAIVFECAQFLHRLDHIGIDQALGEIDRRHLAKRVNLMYRTFIWHAHGIPILSCT